MAVLRKLWICPPTNTFLLELGNQAGSRIIGWLLLAEEKWLQALATLYVQDRSGYHQAVVCFLCIFVLACAHVEAGG